MQLLVREQQAEEVVALDERQPEMRPVQRKVPVT